VIGSHVIDKLLPLSAFLLLFNHLIRFALVEHLYEVLHGAVHHIGLQIVNFVGNFFKFVFEAIVVRYFGQYRIVESSLEVEPAIVFQLQNLLFESSDFLLELLDIGR
jgi:hypothetical protein